MWLYISKCNKFPASFRHLCWILTVTSGAFSYQQGHSFCGVFIRKQNPDVQYFHSNTSRDNVAGVSWFQGLHRFRWRLLSTTTCNPTPCVCVYPSSADIEHQDKAPIGHRPKIRGGSDLCMLIGVLINTAMMNPINGNY